MLRPLIILLLFGLAIGSGAYGLMNHNREKQQPAETAEVVHEYEAIELVKLLRRPPESHQAIELEDFHFGVLPMTFDYDEDEVWDEVYIPLFPANLHKSHNCICVIYHSEKYKTQEELEALLEGETLKGFYNPSNQKLPDAVFSKMARKYGSIDYSKSLLFSDEEPTSPIQYSSAFGAFACFAFFLALAGWQTMSMVTTMKARIAAEKKIRDVADTAGLSAIFESKYEQPQPQSGGSEDINSGQALSFAEQWARDNPDQA